MKYNYSALIGRIVQIFKNHYSFAKAMGMSERTLSLKLNNQKFWKQNEIAKACQLLHISESEIANYFFTQEVQSA